MKLSMLLSPSIWNLLGQLRTHLDVTLDVLDVSFEPLLPVATDAGHQALRALVSDERPRADGVRPRRQFAAALRTGQQQVFDVDGLRVGIFPLRHHRDIVGLIATASPAQEVQTERRVERLGWALRSALEADIATQTSLTEEHKQTRWLTGTLRFLEHLQQMDNERGLMDAVVEAAAVWGDFDARVYRRDLGEHYVLEASLPGVAVPPEGSRMPVLLFESHGEPTRLTSMPEIEQLGWASTAHEVLAIPLQRADVPERVLLIAGAVDAQQEQVFSVVGHLLAMRLAALTGDRQDRMRQALLARLDQRSLRFSARLAGVLREVASAVRASHARLLLPEAGSRTPRILAAVGGSPLASLPSLPDGELRHAGPSRVVLPVSSTTLGTAWLDLGASGDRPFDQDDLMLATTAADVLRPWLSGAIDAFAETSRGSLFPALDFGFEARIQDEIERAKRFKLQAGIIVIDTRQVARERHTIALTPVVDALRSHLRSSDLVGRLRDGDLAALLVHTAPQGVATVASRVERELMRLAAEIDLPPAALGKAIFPVAGEDAASLVAAARSDIQRTPMGRA